MMEIMRDDGCFLENVQDKQARKQANKRFACKDLNFVVIVAIVVPCL